MREQLIQYVNLLFAGAAGTEDIKQEILQNTLDRYDDLVSQGKQPEAAYSLAISGIGDISEILAGESQALPVPKPVLEPSGRFKPEHRNAPVWKKLLRAFAVCLYIISVIPLIILSEFGMEILGLCGMLAIIGFATALIIAAGENDNSAKKEAAEDLSPRQELHKAINSIFSIVTVCVYLAVSFWTGAWWITWLIFPISAAAKGLVRACIDLKEASKNEN